MHIYKYGLSPMDNSSVSSTHISSVFYYIVNINSMDNSSSSPKSAFGRLRRKLSPKKTEKRSFSLSIKESDDASECSSGSSTELQRVFNYFDEDGDGKISAAELQSCVKTIGGELSMEEAKAAIESSDLNGDGLLDLHEFQKLMETSGSEEEKKMTDLREAFGLFEMEGSGCITPASLKRMLSRLGESRSINDCKAMIRAFDLNGDGVLTFDEFAIMLR